MIEYAITSYKTNDGINMIPKDAQISASDITKTSDELNAGLPDWPAGTLIHSPGYATVKEKSLDGSWVKL